MQSIDKPARNLLLIASISGALAVAIGAFGAHTLKPLLLESGRLDTFETGVMYHFYHTIALLATGILSLHLHYRILLISAYCFASGIFLFSGSLYVISIWPHLSYMGVITPVGGILFISGWILLAMTTVRNSKLPA